MGADVFVFVGIGLMALVVYGTRIAGAELMTTIRMTPRIKAFLNAMAMSVLVAIVASEVARNGLRESAAIVSAIIVMAIWRSAIGAMLAGMLLAAAWTWMAM